MVISSGEFERALDEFIARRQRTFYPKTDLEVSVADLVQLRAARSGEAIQLAELLVNHLHVDGSPVRDVLMVANAGTYHLVFRATLNSGSAVFIRLGFVFRHRPNFEFLVESALAPVLKTVRIPAIDIIQTDLTRAILPLDYQVLREATGRPLNVIENPETQFIPDDILENLGRTFARLHQVPADGAGLLNVRSLQSGKIEGVLPSWSTYIRLNLQHHLLLCRDAGALTEEDIRPIEEIFANAASTLKLSHARLLHGDPGHHNIFAAGNQISAIIDWEDALAGDPIFEVAYWGTFVRDYLREPFLRGYREVNPLPADFEYRYWLYYLRVAISKTAHRHLFGYKDRLGRPPASERIKKALAHLRTLA